MSDVRPDNAVGVDPAHLPEALHGLASTLFAERTGDVLEPALVAVDVGSLVVARVVLGRVTRSGDAVGLGLYTYVLDPDGQVAIHVHEGSVCGASCLCYRWVDGKIVDENPHELWRPFGADNDMELLRDATGHSRAVMSAAIQAHMSADALAPTNHNADYWRFYFRTHKLGKAVTAAFDQADAVSEAMPVTAQPAA